MATGKEATLEPIRQASRAGSCCDRSAIEFIPQVAKPQEHYSRVNES